MYDYNVEGKKCVVLKCFDTNKDPLVACIVGPQFAAFRANFKFVNTSFEHQEKEKLRIFLCKIPKIKELSQIRWRMSLNSNFMLPQVLY